MTALNVELARSRREELGLTQDELAKRLNIQQASLSRLEAGEREPRIAFIKRWATELGLTVEQLLTAPERPRESNGDKAEARAS